MLCLGKIKRHHRWTDCFIPKLTRTLFLILTVLFIFSVILFNYICSDQSCSLNSWSSLPYSMRLQLNNMTISRIKSSSNFSGQKMSFDDIIHDNFSFDIKGNDVIVFLHIQKTGGTLFGRHLVRDLDLEKPCQCKRGRKKCKCIRPDSEARMWLFSRYSTGWKCGLHADWTELTNCVGEVLDESEQETNQRRYFYITLLRDPVARFLSEFRHVQRGATWKTSLHMCNGRSATAEELPPCYSGADWSDVSMDEFMDCPFNLAINRQTRMLADLTLVGCYNHSFMPKQQRDMLMLESAKENLRRTAFFGLCELQKVSQYLFESTFHMHFVQEFVQFNETHSSSTLHKLDDKTLTRLRQLNYLDIELYRFARNLLFERFEKMKKRDRNFEFNFQNLGNLRDPNKSQSPTQSQNEVIEKLMSDYSS